jgi:hypothetical protein
VNEANRRSFKALLIIAAVFAAAVAAARAGHAVFLRLK